MTRQLSLLNEAKHPILFKNGMLLLLTQIASSRWMHMCIIPAEIRNDGKMFAITAMIAFCNKGIKHFTTFPPLPL